MSIGYDDGHECCAREVEWSPSLAKSCLCFLYDRKSLEVGIIRGERLQSSKDIEKGDLPLVLVFLNIYIHLPELSGGLELLPKQTLLPECTNGND